MCICIYIKIIPLIAKITFFGGGGGGGGVRWVIRRVRLFGDLLVNSFQEHFRLYFDGSDSTLTVFIIIIYQMIVVNV